jgi:hypothetical protein
MTLKELAEFLAARVATFSGTGAADRMVFMQCPCCHHGNSVRGVELVSSFGDLDPDAMSQKWRLVAGDDSRCPDREGAGE